MKCKNCDSNVEILFVVMANGKEVPIVASSLTDEEFHYMVARKKSEPKLKHKLHHVIHQCKKNTVKENKPVRKKVNLM